MVQAAARPSRPDGRAPDARPACSMMKLEAAGNDFLVVLDVALEPDATRFTAAQVRAVCDRRRGIGADGLIVGRRGGSGADLEMVLFNADGSEAEMSGNGIRCLVHAAVAAALVPPRDVRVATAAGVRTVSYEAAGHGGAAWARVDMGPVRMGEEVQSPLFGTQTRARLADVGNPHLVVIGDVDLDDLDLASLGAAATRSVGGAVNLEVVRPGRNGADLQLRVFERGVGETLACGTGTCAAAAVAREWGMVGDTVIVDNPGGRLEVRLPTVADASGSGDGDEAGDGDGVRSAYRVGRPVGLATIDGVELGGPVRKVADVEVDAALLDASLLDAAGHEGG